VGLVATLTSEVEHESESEDENEVYSKFAEKNLLSLLKSFSHILNIEPMS